MLVGRRRLDKGLKVKKYFAQFVSMNLEWGSSAVTWLGIDVKWPIDIESKVEVILFSICSLGVNVRQDFSLYAFAIYHASFQVFYSTFTSVV